MLKFTEDGHLCGCHFGIGEAIVAAIADAATAIGTAAGSIGLTSAADAAAASAAAAAIPAGVEVATVTAPAIATGLTAGELAAAAAPLAAAAIPALTASPADAAAAAAPQTATPATSTTPETATVTAQAPDAALTGGDLLAAAAPLAAAAAPIAPPTPATPPASQQPSSNATSVGPSPSQTGATPSSATPPPSTPSTPAPPGSSTSLGSPTGGSGSSAASTAAPPSVGLQSPDVTQIQSAGSDLSTGSTSSQLPGSVGSGAASGAPTNATGVGAPIGSAPDPLAPVEVTPSVLDQSLTPVEVTPEVSSAAGMAADLAKPTPSTSLGKFLSDPSLAAAGDVLASNPSAVLGAAGLGLDFLSANKPPQGLPQTNATANNLSTQGKQLQSYLYSGTLPPGVQAGLTAAIDAADASIKSQYASRGMSGSSSEAQDIQAANIRGQSQAADIAMQLYSQGVSDAQISAELYGTIMNESIQQDNQLANAIGNFSTSLAGQSRPIVVQTGA